MTQKDIAAMHILVTGGTGLIGRALVKSLLLDGHVITVFTRQRLRSEERIRYVQQLKEIPQDLDAVVNLAGAGLADRRWSERYKREILSSRVAFTRDLIEYLTQIGMPKVFVSGSAIGFYGESNSASFSETDSKGSGFSAELCANWEAEAQKAASEHTRVVLLRTGVVLEANGGAYPQMTQSFKLGVSSWMGRGRHWLSWIHIDDMVSAIRFCLDHEQLRGPVNMTAPEPVTHRTFAAAVEACSSTWLKLGVPAPVMRVMLGEMADELLLTGQRVLPNTLTAHDFGFKHPTIASAVSALTL